VQLEPEPVGVHECGEVHQEGQHKLVQAQAEPLLCHSIQKVRARRSKSSGYDDYLKLVFDELVVSQDSVFSENIHIQAVVYKHLHGATHEDV